MSAHALINTLVRIEMSIAIFRFPKHGKVADNAQVFETSRTTSRTHSKGYGTRGRDPADWRWRTYPIPGRVRSNISVSGAPGVLLSDRNRFAWRGSAFDPRQRSSNAWVSFVADVTEAEKMWEGRTEGAGTPVSRLEAWLGRRRSRPIINLGARLRGVRSDESDVAHVREQFTHARRSKDEVEIESLRRAAAATAAGFSTLRQHIAPGITERALQIELEAEFFRHGADRVGYGTIVGSGPNAGVLHFSPSQRKIKRGDFVLIDAGAEVDRYVIDVTRTYVAGSKPTQFQRDLLNLVSSVERAAIKRCLPGTE